MVWTYSIKKNGYWISYCKSCHKKYRYKPLPSCVLKEHAIAFEKSNTWQREHRKTHREIMNEYSRKNKRRDSEEAIIHYGGKCACCGYNDINKKIFGKRFLEIDHINGGGSKERREGRVTGNLGVWLKKHGYPTGFRVLDAACNAAMEPGESICEIHKWKH
jgi:hypothetical protein